MRPATLFHHPINLFAGLLATCVLTAIAAPSPADEVRLFNGENLEGWACDTLDESKSIDDIWSVADGVLRCTGKPPAVLRTEREYGDYQLTLQWRWPERGGNSGLLVHCSKPRELAIWPRSLEVQLGSGHAGDFWVIGTEIDVPDESSRVQGRRHLNLSDDSEKPIGEWNKMKVVCRGGDVTVHINGELVNEGTNSTATSGAICLQSEGTPVEFREIVLIPMEQE